MKTNKHNPKKYDYIPYGKKILTRHGCICKNEFYDDNKNLIKDKCTLFGDHEPWCNVQGKCGFSSKSGVNSGKYWDYCLPYLNKSFMDTDIIYGKGYNKRNMIGITLFYSIFVFLIPFILYKNNMITYLTLYFPNLKSLAVSVAYNAGPYGLPIFQQLYNKSSQDFIGYVSAKVINYIVLLSVVYLVGIETLKHKSITKGMVIGFVMLISTYLLPDEIIEKVQEVLGNKLYGRLDPKEIDREISNPLKLYDIKYYFIIVLCGLITTILFIMVEKQIIVKVMPIMPSKLS